MNKAYLVLAIVFHVLVSAAAAETSENPEPNQSTYLDFPEKTFPVEFYITSTTDVVAKQQNNYRTPLDSNDRFLRDIEDNGANDSYDSIEDQKTWGSKDRRGANNRGNQNYRLNSELTMIGLMGKQKTDDQVWYNFASVVQFLVDPNDPDDPNLDDDRYSYGNLQTKDIWFRYTPVLPLAITIGSQTVEATAPAVTIDYTYKGDLDEDFVLYTGSILDSVPGISIETYLAEHLSIGIGRYDSMSVFSELTSSGTKDEAATDAIWITSQSDRYRFSASYQAVKVGGKEDKGDPTIQDVWQRNYKHNVFNSTLKLNLGRFSPYVTYQAVFGEKVDIRTEQAGIDLILDGYRAAGITSATGLIDNQPEGRDMKASLRSLGFIVDLGQLGKLAVDYTSVDSPGYGEDDWVPLFTEGGHETHINYVYELSDNLNFTLFYNHKLAVKDSDLVDDINMLNDSITEMKAADPNESNLRDLEKYTAVLESYRLTSTTSFGIAIQMNFTH